MIKVSVECFGGMFCMRIKNAGPQRAHWEPTNAISPASPSHDQRRPNRLHVLAPSVSVGRRGLQHSPHRRSYARFLRTRVKANHPSYVKRRVAPRPRRAKSGSCSPDFEFLHRRQARSVARPCRIRGEWRQVRLLRLPMQSGASRSISAAAWMIMVPSCAIVSTVAIRPQPNLPAAANC